jgi:glucose-1-phosphate thymidylyltransferase
LEITDLNLEYLRRGELNVQIMGRGMAWLDTGTHESLLHACNFIETLQERQGLMVACIEEIAFNMGYINASQLERLAEGIKKSSYGQYLLSILKEQRFS